MHFSKAVLQRVVMHLHLAIKLSRDFWGIEMYEEVFLNALKMMYFLFFICIFYFLYLLSEPVLFLLVYGKLWFDLERRELVLRVCLS